MQELLFQNRYLDALLLCQRATHVHFGAGRLWAVIIHLVHKYALVLILVLIVVLILIFSKFIKSLFVIFVIFVIFIILYWLESNNVDWLDQFKHSVIGVQLYIMLQNREKSGVREHVFS